MGTGFNKGKPQKDKDGKFFFGPYNDSNKANSSHKVDQPTNFNLQAITLEDIDQSVYQEFNNRFVIGDKKMTLLTGDAETTSLPIMNAENFDPQKGFLAWPLFVFTRTDTKRMLRTNPTVKKVLYAIPKKKAQGIVIEEYLSEGPINYELLYEFKFITYFRESCNQMEEQFNHYFRNKRNIIVVSNERFSIGPENKDDFGNLEMVSREEASQVTMYILTFRLKMWAWTRRGTEDMQKRERPNSYTLNMVMRDEIGRVCNTSKDVIQIEQFIITNHTKPDEKIDPT